MMLYLILLITAVCSSVCGTSQECETNQLLCKILQSCQGTEPDQDLKKLQEELQELQTKMAAGDQKIQALEQRPYIERCESGWLEIPYKSLYDGYGSRQHDLTAKFTRPFRKTPVVTLGFVKLDDDSSKNLRVAAEVTTKSTTGLTVRISTWSDSQLYRAAVHWMACA